MNQHPRMVRMDPSKPYLGIVGCSYTHWFNGDCLGESYPAIIAKQFPNYNVIDLSIMGSSNESVFLRLYNFERIHKIKFSKILWQLTHFFRELIIMDYDRDENIFEDTQKVENYCSTSGHFSKHITFSITGFKHSNMAIMSDYFDIKETDLYKYYVNKSASNQGVWLLQKEIALINSHYGRHNVLIFAWHKNIDLDSTSKNYFAYKWNKSLGNTIGDRSNTAQDLEIDLPKNYVGSVQDMLGHDQFWKLGVDDAPHYGSKGHNKVFEALEPNVQELLKG